MGSFLFPTCFLTFCRRARFLVPALSLARFGPAMSYGDLACLECPSIVLLYEDQLSGLVDVLALSVHRYSLSLQGRNEDPLKAC